MTYWYGAELGECGLESPSYLYQKTCPLPHRTKLLCAEVRAPGARPVRGLDLRRMLASLGHAWSKAPVVTASLFLVAGSLTLPFVVIPVRRTMGLDTEVRLRAEAIEQSET